MIYFIGDERLVASELYKPATVSECLEYFSNKKSIAVDTETQGRNPHTKKILSLQIGDAENQYVIDCRRVPIKHFKALLESKRVLLHNAKFDYKFLKHSGIHIESIWDTMLAECVLNCGRVNVGYGLADLCQRYVGIHLSKDTRGDFYKLETQPFTDEQVRYAAADVAYLHKIANLQYESIHKYDLLYAVELENQAVKALADIEYNGMYLDPQAWKQNALNFEEALRKSILDLDDYILTLDIGHKAINFGVDLFSEPIRFLNINYGSPKQVLELLNRCDLHPEGTNDRELAKLAKKHPIVPKIQAFRKAAKVVSTYGLPFLDNISKATGRIHSDFWQVLKIGHLLEEILIDKLSKFKELRLTYYYSM